MLLLTLSLGIAEAEDPPSQTAPPAWYLTEIAMLTADGGRWVTDNSEYQSEEEPYDSYVTEWQASFEGATMTGRLFGIADGKESVDFWEFRLYWHPVEQRAVMAQFGWGGSVGIGPTWLEDGATKSDQVFYAADGSATRTGHVSRFPDANTHLTASFDIDGDDWTLRRNYIWRRATAAAN
jgi:hypothetical protein